MKSLERFKMAAAFAVIAIHTGPLSSFTVTGDYVLTRIICRIAVPFFFMITGYFAVPEKSAGFIKNTVKLYGLAMLLYLPINIYTGYFREAGIGWQLIKDLLFDGTFYHLWYLPASIIGVFLVTLFLKRGPVFTFVLSLLLYAAGLAGDSYNGLFENTSWLFLFSDYTRNGIFFAPVFISLGYLIKKYKLQIRLKWILTGFLVSFAVMIAEGMILYNQDIPRHDSMYLMLLPTMFFLFTMLLRIPGDRNIRWKRLSMLIYILHPLMIVLLRGFAKVAGLTELLIENSLVYFAGTVLLSVLVSGLCILVMEKGQQKGSGRKRAWLEINLDHLGWNFLQIKKRIPESCELIAVVKANAYGHGAVPVSRYLNGIGVYSFAVATLEEGIQLRKKRIKGKILVLGYTHPKDVSLLIKYRLTQTVVDNSYAKQLNQLKQRLHVHIKVDTGMHRLGEDCADISRIEEIFQCRYLQVDGIYSHLCTADSNKPADVAFTHHQISLFSEAVRMLKERGYDPGMAHIQSSYGLLNYPEYSFDAVRIGIALYGVKSSEKSGWKENIYLKPVLSLKARVAAVYDVKKGETIGYGRSYKVEKTMRTAVVTIGYADGIPRNMGQEGSRLLIGGVSAPIIGRICMDQLIADVSEAGDLGNDNVATLIGKDGSAFVSAEETADICKTITNELLSRLGSRLERIVTEGEKSRQIFPAGRRKVGKYDRIESGDLHL